jgi:hypothetical protein
VAEALIALHLGLQDIFPHDLVFVRNGLHERLNEVFGRLHAKNG